MWNKLLGWTALALLLSLAPGCSRIHEPWIQHPDQLQTERSRSPALLSALRLRLAETQRDR
jgi:hypothetical protein